MPPPRTLAALRLIFNEAQHSSSKHGKCVQRLRNAFKIIPQEEFVTAFTDCLITVFSGKSSNAYTTRLLEFVALFCASFAVEDEQNRAAENAASADSSFEEDTPTSPELLIFFNKVLEFHDHADVNFRYNVCLLITKILHNLGNTSLDNDLCDQVEESMLNLLGDGKVCIRKEAITALTRLQDTSIQECPVITAINACLEDVSPLVRRTAVNRIAPTQQTIQRVFEMIRDTDPSVRQAVYIKFAAWNPKFLRIAQRQVLCVHAYDAEDDNSPISKSNQIVQSPWVEDSPQVRNAFESVMLPRWLANYNDNILDFLNALKLDAEPADYRRTYRTYDVVIGVLLRTRPVQQLIETLPLRDSLLPLVARVERQQIGGGELLPGKAGEGAILDPKQRLEAVFLWRKLIAYVLSKDIEEQFGALVPDMEPLTQLIQSYINSKNRGNALDDFEHLTFQHMLLQLFGIVNLIDFSDEGIKKIVRPFVIKTMLECRLQQEVAEVVVQIFAKCDKVEKVASEVCHIISEIHEPLVPQQPDPQTKEARDYQRAQLKVNLNIAKHEYEAAISDKDFDEASAKNALVEQLNAQLKALPSDDDLLRQAEPARRTVTDPVVISYCVDLLVGVLRLPQLPTLFNCLHTAQSEFLYPLLIHKSPEVLWRTLLAIGLCCIRNRELAVNYVRVLCNPVIIYRVMPGHNIESVAVSMQVVSDIIAVWGSDVLSPLPQLPRASLDCADTESDGSSLATVDSGTSDATVGRSNAMRPPHPQTPTTSGVHLGLHGVTQLGPRRKRRLYTNNQNSAETERLESEAIRPVEWQELLLEMMDDENTRLADIACMALKAMVMENDTVSPCLLSRLLLKWINPQTGRNLNLSYNLTYMLLYYANNYGKCDGHLESAVIPVLDMIAKAPPTSPLADCDIPKILQFFAVITQDDSNYLSNAHRSYTNQILVALKSGTQVVSHEIYAQFLLYLNPPNPNEPQFITEIKALCEEVVENQNKKVVNKHVRKYMCKLSQIEIEAASAASATTTAGDSILNRSISTIDATNENDNIRPDTATKEPTVELADTSTANELAAAPDPISPSTRCGRIVKQNPRYLDNEQSRKVPTIRNVKVLLQILPGAQLKLPPQSNNSRAVTESIDTGQQQIEIAPIARIGNSSSDTDNSHFGKRGRPKSKSVRSGKVSSNESVRRSVRQSGMSLIGGRLLRHRSDGKGQSKEKQNGRRTLPASIGRTLSGRAKRKRDKSANDASTGGSDSDFHDRISDQRKRRPNIVNRRWPAAPRTTNNTTSSPTGKRRFSSSLSTSAVPANAKPNAPRAMSHILNHTLPSRLSLRRNLEQNNNVRGATISLDSDSDASSSITTTSRRSERLRIPVVSLLQDTDADSCTEVDESESPVRSKIVKESSNETGTILNSKQFASSRPPRQLSANSLFSVSSGGTKDNKGSGAAKDLEAPAIINMIQSSPVAARSRSSVFSLFSSSSTSSSSCSSSSSSLSEAGPDPAQLVTSATLPKLAKRIKSSPSSSGSRESSTNRRSGRNLRTKSPCSTITISSSTSQTSSSSEDSIRTNRRVLSEMPEKQQQPQSNQGASRLRVDMLKKQVLHNQLGGVDTNSAIQTRSPSSTVTTVGTENRRSSRQQSAFGAPASTKRKKRHQDGMSSSSNASQKSSDDMTIEQFTSASSSASSSPPHKRLAASLSPRGSERRCSVRLSKGGRTPPDNRESAASESKRSRNAQRPLLRLRTRVIAASSSSDTEESRKFRTRKS